MVESESVQETSSSLPIPATGMSALSLDLPSELRRAGPQRLPSVTDNTGRRDHCHTVVIGLRANFVCDKRRPVFPVKP